MSDEFLKVAKKEIQSEIDSLERIIKQCQSDEDILKDSENIKDHLHRIKGLAPMIGHKNIGDVAKAGDIIIKHVMSKGTLQGSCITLVAIVGEMQKIFLGNVSFDIESFQEMVRKKLPHLPGL